MARDGSCLLASLEMQCMSEGGQDVQQILSANALVIMTRTTSIGNCLFNCLNSFKGKDNSVDGISLTLSFFTEGLGPG